MLVTRVFMLAITLIGIFIALDEKSIIFNIVSCAAIVAVSLVLQKAAAEITAVFEWARDEDSSRAREKRP